MTSHLVSGACERASHRLRGPGGGGRDGNWRNRRVRAVEAPLTAAKRAVPLSPAAATRAVVWVS